MAQRRDLRDLLEPDPQTGRVRLAGHPYLLIRPETLVPVIASGDAQVVALLVAGGRAGGVLAARAVQAAGLDGREAVGAVLASGGVIGWGRFDVAWTDRGAAVRLWHSPFAEAAQPAAGPVCHLVRGVLLGVWEQVFRGPAACFEVACAAQGAPVCTFRLGPEGRPD